MTDADDLSRFEDAITKAPTCDYNEAPIKGFGTLAGLVAKYQAQAAQWEAETRAKDAVIAAKDEMIALLKELLELKWHE